MFEFISQNIIKQLVNRKVICWNNDKPEHLRIVKGEYSSFQVPKFMTKIHYPPNKDRDYSMTVYIHYLEYKIKKIIEKEKLSIKSLEDYKKVYFRVLEEENYKEEFTRFYNNWLRREDFKNARSKARIR